MNVANDFDDSPLSSGRQRRKVWQTDAARMILDACSQSKVEWATQIQISQASKKFTTSIRLQSSGPHTNLDQEKVFVLIASNALNSYYSSSRELGRPLREVSSGF